VYGAVVCVEFNLLVFSYIFHHIAVLQIVTILSIGWLTSFDRVTNETWRCWGIRVEISKGWTSEVETGFRSRIKRKDTQPTEETHQK
jgi:hypothetical protein